MDEKNPISRAAQARLRGHGAGKIGKIKKKSR